MSLPIETTVDDVFKSMMHLETAITNNKKQILDSINENDSDKLSNAAYQFSENIFMLFVKRFKHGLFKKGEYEKARNFDRLLEINKESIEHTISANSLKVLMNVQIYNINLDDTFMELLKESSEYLKPILMKVVFPG